MQSRHSKIGQGYEAFWRKVLFVSLSNLHISHWLKIHTIRKVKFLSKNSILTKPQHFHEFFTQIFFVAIFLVKSKLSTAKKSKTTTFSRVFHPKKSTLFSGNQSWIFGQKMKISNSVILIGMEINFIAHFSGERWAFLLSTAFNGTTSPSTPCTPAIVILGDFLSGACCTRKEPCRPKKRNVEVTTVSLITHPLMLVVFLPSIESGSKNLAGTIQVHT